VGKSYQYFLHGLSFYISIVNYQYSLEKARLKAHFLPSESMFDGSCCVYLL
jgi:hypothetical protein